MSTVFAAKAAPSDEKLRGGYYTPEPIARFVADWVADAGPRLLEPSCGDGSILQFLAPRGDATGIELFPEEAEAARARTGAPVEDGDFFTWFTPDRHGQYDGVAGNPPYIRFGSWEERYREPAFDLMRGQGLAPTRLTNAWLPFVVASLVAVREGGRVGLVIPAELLQVGYAAQLRAYLVDSCSEITVVAFKELLFPGILQEVVLLLAVKGPGPAAIRTVEVQNGAHLDEVTLDGARTRAPLHETEKWTKYFLTSLQISALRDLRQDSRLARLGTFAKINVGVVTGRNSFFCMTEAEAKEREIEEHTVNLLSRSAQFTGVGLTGNDMAFQAMTGSKTRLLVLAADHDVEQDPALERYLRLGELDGVHEGYKCRIRSSWWSVPSVSQPAGFMLRQVSTYLRLISNDANATSTDTVHRVFVQPGVDMRKLAVAALNSATLAMSEVTGRSYGGGLLEVEPTEAVSLPVPDPSIVDDALVNDVDKLLRAGKINNAISMVDMRLMVETVGFTEAEISLVRAAGDRLRARRLGRGRGAASNAGQLRTA
ncbi:class I SAM-dependent methyltransferase [Arthrobacter sp. AFG20]|uniref:N-6 DNA methylase n=1 Tax=Arthrobacter sp. AFG20 TaxID=1688671 RepID=UPI000C9E9DB0|nr:class I SAM-dependent methyltransferase [Arthrobacter sp. AFG20]PNH86116.1 SAM-dependent methyltransferase [Arthrobacter sp. AFG20]